MINLGTRVKTELTQSRIPGLSVLRFFECNNNLCVLCGLGF